MSGLLWKVNRLRAMGAGEIAARLRNAAQARLERAGFGRAQPQEPIGRCGAPIAGGRAPDVDPAPFIAAAERILAGRWQVFALDAELGFPPAWNRDPKTGAQAPMSFGKSLNYRDERLVGDIKYLWEPNRHLELVTLAQAWALTGEARFADGCRTLVESWIAACPYPCGPNWTSSLEHAIRLVNWSFAWGLLGGEEAPLFRGEDGAAFKARWLVSIRQHLHFVAGHFSTHSSANNHLLGEYLGLLVGSLTWPLWRESGGWLETAFRGFEAQALLQNTPDGVNREQAVYYQHEVMDMMLVAGLAARANGRDFSAAYWQRLERLCEFLAAAMDVRGRVPMIGDSDDALLLRLDPSPGFEPYRPLLAAGAILFKRGDFAAKAGRLDDKTRWLFPEATWAKQAGSKGAPKLAFPDGGYFILGDRFDTATEVRMVCDCGLLGYLSIAAHGHADALAFTLSAFGTEWLVDPGTYAYHTQKAWRDHFRGTGAHNTVRIDGLDQSVIGGNFLWLRKANARLIGHGPTRFEGEHDGYARLKDPVVHRRRIDFDPGADTIRVRDTIIAKASHNVEICWQFGEDCAVEAAGADVMARADGRALRLSCGAPGFVAALFTGSEAPIAGWVSRSFDRKAPATMARWSARIEGTTEVETILRFE